MHPELSGQEQRTAGIVADKLRKYGLKVSTGVGGQGVIGLLEGKREGPVVAWRADMDAVPGDEILDAPYRSCVPGVIHICGHDAHTTVGLGIARVATPPLIDACLQSIRSLSTLGFPASAAGLTDFLDSMDAGSSVLDRFIVITCSQISILSGATGEQPGWPGVALPG